MLHRHGFARGDDQHAGRAIFLIGDLARIYEGSRTTPTGPPSPRRHTCRHPSGPAQNPNLDVRPRGRSDAVTLTHAEVRTVLTSLDLAADWKRDRAQMCADCADQSCFACQLRLQEARTYDQPGRPAAARRQAARNLRRQAEPHAPPGQPGLAADKEPASDYHRQGTGRTRTPPPGRRRLARTRGRRLGHARDEGPL